jgi:hypothetical protein
MVLALEAAAWLVRVDDHVGLGQREPGQVVVGHQHLQAERTRGGHAFEAGDAVVHRDQQVGAALLHAPGDGGGQAVAVDHAVGHEVVDVLRAQQAQAAHGHGAGGGAVAVVVGHDADLASRGDGIGQQLAASGMPFRPAGGSRRAQAVVQLVLPEHAARGVQARQQRVDAGLLQRPGGARRDVAGTIFTGPPAVATRCGLNRPRCAGAGRRRRWSRSGRGFRRTA